MPKTIDRTLPIKRFRKVVATVDLPGVPEGTIGKVRVANGFTWYRYWVDFDNGVRMGQVSHEHLCHEGDWGRFQLDRAEAERRALEALEAPEASGEGDGPVEVAAGNRFGVPEHLLQRSSDARTRLGG
ncbi:MAG: hypothetical protein MK177_09320 [Acidimicrobiales bacterium]|jgi:hypothetical protein|uniref:Uncharacterized protein n=1 Tax=marine metagenome TaxID=408172 RepID=A0A381QYP3_9ZZZZ|nr:hypothetical protein [Acidimicrobiales bacterium]|tara:strand:+ start:61 stop:444 length:384 start_codon:yes stop_codon:yes gene_type:complete